MKHYDYVSIESSSPDILILFTETMYVDITLGDNLAGKVRGLCGNFDGNPNSKYFNIILCFIHSFICLIQKQLYHLKFILRFIQIL